MAKSQQAHNDKDEFLYAVDTPDQLGVLSSTRVVTQQSEYVWINSDQIDHFGTQLLANNSIASARNNLSATKSASSTSLWYDRYHFFDGTEQTVNWLLVLDAMNFCFWAAKGQPRWHIEYKGELLDGYFAEAAALTRAVEEGIPLWDAHFLSKMSRDELGNIFRGEPANINIPLFEQRLKNVREVGQVLLKRYDGQFSNALEQVAGDAVALALLLVREFSSFRDIAFYRKHEIRFYKRAQICVADLHGSFKGRSWGTFKNLDQLTAFADYKLPQVLRHFGILEYAPSLAERIDNQELLEPGSNEEIEIRAATIWACELLKRALDRQGKSITAAEIDQYLWLLGQNAAEMRPYHRVRTMYY